MIKSSENIQEPPLRGHFALSNFQFKLLTLLGLILVTPWENAYK